MANLLEEFSFVAMCPLKGVSILAASFFASQSKSTSLARRCRVIVEGGTTGDCVLQCNLGRLRLFIFDVSVILLSRELGLVKLGLDSFEDELVQNMVHPRSSREITPIMSSRHNTSPFHPNLNQSLIPLPIATTTSTTTTTTTATTTTISTASVSVIGWSCGCAE